MLGPGTTAVRMHCAALINHVGSPGKKQSTQLTLAAGCAAGTVVAGHIPAVRSGNHRVQAGRRPRTVAAAAGRRSSFVAVADTAGSSGSGRSHPAVAAGNLDGSGLVTRTTKRRTGCWGGIAGRTGLGYTDRRVPTW